MPEQSYYQKRHEDVRKRLRNLSKTADEAQRQYERGDKTMCMTHLHRLEADSVQLRDLISNMHYYSHLDEAADIAEVSKLIERS